MNLGSLLTARRDWHVTYTLLTSMCKLFVVKALALFTVEHILSEWWLLWTTYVRKGDENTQKRIVLPWEDFCQAGQIWTHVSGLCFPGRIWWARMGFTGVRNGTRAKGPLGEPTAPAAPAQTETNPLFWVSLTSWGLVFQLNSPGKNYWRVLLRFSLTVLPQVAFGRESWRRSQLIHILAFWMYFNQLQQGQGTKAPFKGRARMFTADLPQLLPGRLGNLTIFCQMFFIRKILWFILLAWLPYMAALQTLYFWPGSVFLFLVLQLIS